MSIALEAGVRRIFAAVKAVQALNPVVLIDGRSGAGKSSLAQALIASWPLPGRVQMVVHRRGQTQGHITAIGQTPGQVCIAEQFVEPIG